MAPLAILGLGIQELVIILVIVIVLFGAKRIPEIMRGLGQGIRQFKQASQEAVDEVKSLTEEPPDESDSNSTPVG